MKVEMKRTDEGRDEGVDEGSCEVIGKGLEMGWVRWMYRCAIIWNMA